MKRSYDMKQCYYMLIVFSSLAGVFAKNNVESYDGLLSRLEALEEKDQFRATRQQEQDTLITNLQNELDRERQLRQNVEEALTTVKQRLEAQDRHIVHLNNKNNQQNKMLKKLKLALTENSNVGKENAVKDLLYKRQDQNFMETAAFHATLDQDAGLEHITVGSTIPFPNVKLNIGGGYNNNTSTFTAPMSGLYIFSVSISSYWNDHGELHVGVMKNGVYIAGAYVDDIGGPPEQGSVTLPMQLQVGDKVWIKHVVHEDGALYGGGLTSFMGCLVYAL